MSNVLQKAFYLNRSQDAVCSGICLNLNSLGEQRLRSRCGAAVRRRTRVERASMSLVADWRAVLQNSLYAAPAQVRANVSSITAKPTPLLRPAQSNCDRLAANTRQQR